MDTIRENQTRINNQPTARRVMGETAELETIHFWMACSRKHGKVRFAAIQRFRNSVLLWGWTSPHPAINN
jgi:hypothetical protein